MTSTMTDRVARADGVPLDNRWRLRHTGARAAEVEDLHAAVRRQYQVGRLDDGRWRAAACPSTLQELPSGRADSPRSSPYHGPRRVGFGHTTVGVCTVSRHGVRSGVPRVWATSSSETPVIGSASCGSPWDKPAVCPRLQLLKVRSCGGRTSPARLARRSARAAYDLRNVIRSRVCIPSRCSPRQSPDHRRCAAPRAGLAGDARPFPARPRRRVRGGHWDPHPPLAHRPLRAPLNPGEPRHGVAQGNGVAGG